MSFKPDGTSDLYKISFILLFFGSIVLLTYLGTIYTPFYIPKVSGNLLKGSYR